MRQNAGQFSQKSGEFSGMGSMGDNSKSSSQTQQKSGTSAGGPMAAGMQNAKGPFGNASEAPEAH